MKSALFAALLLGLLPALPTEGRTQEEPGPSRVLVLLEAGDRSGLLEEVRAHPDSVRGALADLFRRAAGTADSTDRVATLDLAKGLAQAYAQVWGDPFLTRQVEQFALWSTGERAEKLEADSLRLAGIEAYYGEGPEAAVRFWERALALCRGIQDEAGQAVLLGNLGAGFFALGDLDRAIRYYDGSLELATEIGDHRTRGTALGNIASVHKDRGAYALAADYYQLALEARAVTGDRNGEVADLNNLGLVMEALGDLAGAEEQYRRALRLNLRDERLRSAANNLTNLANLAVRRGDYETALGLYNEALANRLETGDRQGEALDRQNLGLLYLNWGDYPAAAQSLRASLAILEELDMPLRAAELRADLAAAHTAMGQLEISNRYLIEAIAGAEGDEYLAPLLAMQQADVLTELNELDLAADLYREAAAGYERLNDPSGRAQAQTALGYLLLAREDHEAAEEAFSRALRVHELEGDLRPAAMARVRLADARSLRGDTAAARGTYQEALAAYRQLGDAVGEAVVRGALAELDFESGALRRAEAGFTAALDGIAGQPVGPIRWHLLLGRGLTLRGQGRLDEAISDLRSAAQEVETIGAGLPVADRRYGYMEDKWRLYAELAWTQTESGRPTEAFETSERMRARQLVDLLSRGRAGSPPSGLALLREEENLRLQINLLSGELYSSLRAGADHRDLPEPVLEVAELRESLTDARERYRRLMVELEEAQPEYAALFSTSVAKVGEVQALLAPDAVLVEYLVSEEWTLAFVVSKRSIDVLNLPVTRTTLQQLVRFLRGTLRPEGEEELWRTPLRRLHSALVGPLEEAGYLDDASMLVLAPHGELHYLPFQALLTPTDTGGAFLIESYDITYVPSASVWMELTGRRAGERNGRLLAMAPEPGILPHSETEVLRIVRGNPAAEVLVGDEATESRFREAAPGSDALHLATLGVLNSENPLFSYLQLNGDEGSDGRLETHEVFGLRLDADLVVLSACETGLGSGIREDVPPGDDWVGLVRAFLYAGARSVLASLWTVEDQATATLMERFYDGLERGRSETASLAEAQRWMLRQPEHRNPFFWAAFVLSGGGP